MKTFLVLLFGLIVFTLHAEKYPITLEASVEIPMGTNGGMVINNYITNIITTNVTITNVSYTLVNSNHFETNFYITNITVISPNQPSSIVTLNNNIIDAKLGTRLQRNFLVSPTFSFANFTDNAFATVYIRNPNRVMMNFPANVIWMGTIITNQARAAFLVESVSGELWITP